MSAIFAGIIFLNCAFFLKLPNGTSVNGKEVGGLSFKAAELVLKNAEVERLKGVNLHICAGQCVHNFAYPEFNYSADFAKTLKGITKKGEYFSPVTYYLNCEDEVLDGICKSVEREITEPYVVFNKTDTPFTYCEGADGIKCDRAKLKEDVERSLNSSFTDVQVTTQTIERQGSIADLKNITTLLCTFSTTFDPENEGRVSNIKLAAEKINGSVIYPNECFSFNKVVGERTQKNGFTTAKIIEGGRFVNGVGGGVCQVSTTLYNAALLSGLQICEYHPHSLGVSYVPPSRDAMVSGNYFDLKFKNNRSTPIYVRMNVKGSCITCSIYGESDGYSYDFVSQIVGTIPPPESQIVVGDEDKIISREREGIESLGYLLRQKDGEVQKLLVRKDRYHAVGEVRQVKGTLQEEKEEQEGVPDIVNNG
jgi:vancomycin resistance protein YoaR